MLYYVCVMKQGFTSFCVQICTGDKKRLLLFETICTT